MAKKSLENYVEVRERLALFWVDFPTGSIKTFIAMKDGPEIIFEARIYRTREDVIQDVYTSGFARELEGSNNINTTSHTEVGETSAIGRALANMGYSTRADEPRPSREEMQKAEQTQAQFDADLTVIGTFMNGEDDVEVTIRGKNVWLKEFIQKNKDRVLSQPSAAAEVARYIDEFMNADAGEGLEEQDTEDDGIPTVGNN